VKYFHQIMRILRCSLIMLLFSEPLELLLLLLLVLLHSVLQQLHSLVLVIFKTLNRRVHVKNVGNNEVDTNNYTEVEEEDEVDSNVRVVQGSHVHVDLELPVVHHHQGEEGHEAAQHIIEVVHVVNTRVGVVCKNLQILSNNTSKHSHSDECEDEVNNHDD